MRTSKLTILAGVCLAALAVGQESPTINGHTVDPDVYRQLFKYGFLPTRTTFLSNEDIARKFDLTLPQMATIKAALDKNDPAALEKALIHRVQKALLLGKVVRQAHLCRIIEGMFDSDVTVDDILLWYIAQLCAEGSQVLIVILPIIEDDTFLGWAQSIESIQQR